MDGTFCQGTDGGQVTEDVGWPDTGKRLSSLPGGFLSEGAQVREDFEDGNGRVHACFEASYWTRVHFSTSVPEF